MNYFVRLSFTLSLSSAFKLNREYISDFNQPLLLPNQQDSCLLQPLIKEKKKQNYEQDYPNKNISKSINIQIINKIYYPKSQDQYNQEGDQQDENTEIPIDTSPPISNKTSTNISSQASNISSNVSGSNISVNTSTSNISVNTSTSNISANSSASSADSIQLDNDTITSSSQNNSLRNASSVGKSPNQPKIVGGQQGKIKAHNSNQFAEFRYGDQIQMILASLPQKQLGLQVNSGNLEWTDTDNKKRILVEQALDRSKNGVSFSFINSFNQKCFVRQNKLILFCESDNKADEAFPNDATFFVHMFNANNQTLYSFLSKSQGNQFFISASQDNTRPRLQLQVADQADVSNSLNKFIVK